MSNNIAVHYNEKLIYNIVIEKNFDKLSESVSSLSAVGRKLCIVSDSNVSLIYADKVKHELEKNGNSVFVFTFPAGEENKTLDVVADLYEFLISCRFDRKDMLVALGGGVVGDLTGFAASTYLRGIDFIQIPTSLLAQVDSSIGGKTGVDFRGFKNMVGAFHQPKLVYINIGTLKSLNTRLFNSGLGEIIKHGLIKSPEYYSWLKENTVDIKNRDLDTLETMISKSCEIKRNVVEIDPTEQGDRALLNFGHTLGHAIEKLMSFSLYHGECVALGMIAALELSKNRGNITQSEVDDALQMISAFEFPVSVKELEPKDIVMVSKSDKKMDAGVIKFILLDSIGHAYIDKTVTDEEMINALKILM